MFPKIRLAIANLERWFLNHQRTLPFRINPVPYTTWISEIMAQQTTMNAVIPYYLRFIETYPTVFDLASAKEEDILSLWSGLGYYSRAKNLHKTAQIVVSKYAGEFPEHKKDLLALPGIGEYTSGAILSIALNQPVPIVDTNIRRVLCRLKGMTLSQKKLWKLSTYLVQYTAEYCLAPRLFNQALMELGALVCLHKQPRCHNCPLNLLCQTHLQKKDSDHIPQIPIKKEKIFLQENQAFCVYWEKNIPYVLLEKNTSRWTTSFWDLPSLEDTESMEHGMSSFSIQYTITHHKICRNVYLFVHAKKRILKPNQCYMNMDLLMQHIPVIPINSAFKKCLMYVKKHSLIETKK